MTVLYVALTVLYMALTVLCVALTVLYVAVTVLYMALTALHVFPLAECRGLAARNGDGGLGLERNVRRGANLAHIRQSRPYI